MIKKYLKYWKLPKPQVKPHFPLIEQQLNRIPHGCKGWMFDEIENIAIRDFWLDHECTGTRHIFVESVPDALYNGVVVSCKTCGQSKDVTSYVDI